MGRAPCCDKANVKRGPWSPDEDAKLKAHIEKYGTGGNWIALPRKIGLKRCGKSCRLRWLNYLRPNIKHGGFTEEEDNIICSLYISIGSRWSIIAAQLPGRTDNDIKNYWNTRLKKKLLGRRKQSNAKGRAGVDFEANRPQGGSPQPSDRELSSSALERLQLHMQLQCLQNPLSYFYSNPALWSKLHPLLQENMIQSFQFVPQHILDLHTPGQEYDSTSASHPESQLNGDFYSPAVTSSQPAFEHASLKLITEKVDNMDSQVELGTYSNAIYDNSRSLALGPLTSISWYSGESTPINHTSDIIMSNIDQLSDTRNDMTELETMANNRNEGVMSLEKQEFDYFEASDGSDECFNWWSKDFQMRDPVNPLYGPAAHHEGIF